MESSDKSKVNRYEAVIDIAKLVAAGKDTIVLHVPSTMFTRLCKNASEENSVHFFLGRKRRDTASGPITTSKTSDASSSFVIRYPSEITNPKA